MVFDYTHWQDIFEVCTEKRFHCGVTDVGVG